MMRVKRYQASTLEEALHLVRSDLGRDAIILETHRVRLPGLKGLFAPQITEVAAVGDNTEVHVPWDALSRAEQPAPRPFSAVKQPEATPHPAITIAKSNAGEVADVFSLSPEAAALTGSHVESFIPGLAGADELPKVITAGFQRRSEPPVLPPTSDADVPPQAPPAATQPPAQDLAAEVEELHGMLAQVQAALRELSNAQTHMLKGAPAATAQAVADPATEPADRLAMLAASLGLSERAMALLSPGPVAADAAPADLRRCLEAALAERIPVVDAAASAGRPAVLLLIGGTGVGKSSAAGRIAALLAAQGPVALATIGASGLAGPSQLLTHCVREGVTFRACRGMAGLAGFVADEAAHFNTIVVDTPGGNLQSPETRRLVEEARGMDADVRVLLVASASTHPTVVERAVDGQAGDVSGLVVTKLDEAGSFGALVDLALTRDLPIAYVSAAASLTTGLVPADAATLATCVTGVRRAQAGKGKASSGHTKAQQ